MSDALASHLPRSVIHHIYLYQEGSREMKDDADGADGISPLVYLG